MNPEIDIGQIEGAFVMGLGFHLTEKIRYNPDNGQLITDGTWVSVINNVDQWCYQWRARSGLPLHVAIKYMVIVSKRY